VKYVEQLQELFSGLDRVHGTIKIDESLEGDKVQGKAYTIAKPPTTELWEAHLKGERNLGIVPIKEDGTIVWACIDIDSYKDDVCKATVKFCREYSLPFVVCRSKSGGAHVFVFFKEPIAAKLVVKKLSQFAKAMGFDGAEIFPKQVSIGPEDFGNWLNMPYFDWEVSVRYAYGDEGQRLELPEFLEYAENKKLTLEVWKSLSIPELEHPFNDGPPCLQQMAKAKIGEGGRNNALLQFGVYAKLKYGENDYQDKVAEYNYQYFVPPVAQREMTDTIFKSLDRRDYGYVCTQQPQASFCNRAVCLRRRHGIGGAADEEFEATMEMYNLRKLLYLSPTGQPLDDDPEWELTVQGRTIRFTTSQLQVQTQFASRCINKLNIWPPPLPNPRWREMIQSHLSNCEEIEIPFETSPVAQTLEELKAYIARNAHAKNNLDLLNGLALKKDDCYRFRLESLVEFMRDKSRTTVNIKTVADHLELLGLNRSKTTARQGADHVAVVCWEVGVKQLAIYEEDFQQEHNEAAF